MPVLRSLQRAQVWNHSGYICVSCRHTLLLGRRQLTRSQTSLSPFEGGGDDWLSNFNDLSDLQPSAKREVSPREPTTKRPTAFGENASPPVRFHKGADVFGRVHRRDGNAATRSVDCGVNGEEKSQERGEAQTVVKKKNDFDSLKLDLANKLGSSTNVEEDVPVIPESVQHRKAEYASRLFGSPISRSDKRKRSPHELRRSRARLEAYLRNRGVEIIAADQKRRLRENGVAANQVAAETSASLLHNMPFNVGIRARQNGDEAMTFEPTRPQQTSMDISAREVVPSGAETERYEDGNPSSLASLSTASSGARRKLSPEAQLAKNRRDHRRYKERHLGRSSPSRQAYLRRQEAARRAADSVPIVPSNRESRTQFEHIMPGISQMLKEQMRVMMAELRPDTKPDEVNFSVGSETRPETRKHSTTVPERIARRQKPVSALTSTSTPSYTWMTSPQGTDRPLSLAEKVAQAKHRPKWGDIATTMSREGVLAPSLEELQPRPEHETETPSTAVGSHRNADMPNMNTFLEPPASETSARDEDGNTKFLNLLGTGDAASSFQTEGAGTTGPNSQSRTKAEPGMKYSSPPSSAFFKPFASDEPPHSMGESVATSDQQPHAHKKPMPARPEEGSLTMDGLKRRLRSNLSTSNPMPPTRMDDDSLATLASSGKNADMASALSEETHDDIEGLLARAKSQTTNGIDNAEAASTDVDSRLHAPSLKLPTFVGPNPSKAPAKTAHEERFASVSRASSGNDASTEAESREESSHDVEGGSDAAAGEIATISADAPGRAAFPSVVDNVQVSKYPSEALKISKHWLNSMFRYTHPVPETNRPQTPKSLAEKRPTPSLKNRQNLQKQTVATGDNLSLPSNKRSPSFARLTASAVEKARRRVGAKRIAALRKNAEYYDRLPDARGAHDADTETGNVDLETPETDITSEQLAKLHSQQASINANVHQSESRDSNELNVPEKEARLGRVAAVASNAPAVGDQSSAASSGGGDDNGDGEEKPLWEVMSQVRALTESSSDGASSAGAATNVENTEQPEEPPLDLSSSEPASVLTIKPSDLKVTPLNIPQPAVPGLEYGLDRVLFNPGVYQLQDPLSRVYNFDPYLQKIMPVVEFDFNALKEYKTSSQDTMLSALAKNFEKRYIGSTSSMTGMLGHFHYLLSSWRPLNLNMLSRGFTDKLESFTLLNRAPNAIFLRWKNGTYAIDADKQYDSGNVLMLLGKSMEKLLTTPTSEYERYRKSDPRTVSEKERTAPEAFEYTTMGDFLMRSQLDAHDPRLPGTGMFDLKTRAVISVRMDAEDFQPMTGYEIHTLQGRFGSYEREFYDMMRSTMLKYMLQARMGRMDGIFIAYHNVERIFGFQYLPIPEMDRAIHGQVDRCLGDQEFKASLELVNKIFDKATAKFPGQSLRFHFETTTESLGGSSTTVMWIFGEPMDEPEIERIQSTSKEKVAEFERNMMGVVKDTTSPNVPAETVVADSDEAEIGRTGTNTVVDLKSSATLASQRSTTSSEYITSNSGGDPDFLTSIASSTTQERKPLFAASLICKSRVNGISVERPQSLKPTDVWEVEYLLREWNAPDAMWAKYEQMKARRQELFEKYRSEEEATDENGNVELTSKQKREKAFIDFLRSMSQSGREFRNKINQLEADKDPVIVGQPLNTSIDTVEEDIGTVNEYMAWLYGSGKV